MPFWQWLLDAAGVLLLLAVLWAVGVFVRRRWISRSGGTFECSIRVGSAKVGRGWVLGVSRYTDGRLDWFRLFSLSPRPKLSLRRSELEYVGRREPANAESYALYSGHIVVSCRTPSGELEVAMSPDALTGMLAWLESAPPGQGTRRVR